MNEFITSFYIAGGIKQMLAAEFMRGMAWGFGFFMITCAILTIPVICLVIYFLRKRN